MWLLLVLVAAAADLVVGTQSPQVLERVDPDPPPGGGSADCKVLFAVSEDGTPSRVEVTGCTSPFREAARDAALRWRFQPAVVDGRAVPYRYSAHMVFGGRGPLRAELHAEAPPGAVRILHREEPVPPEELEAAARRAGLDEVRARVRIHVGPDGVPLSATVLEAPGFLRDALVEAAMRWRFEPMVVEGRATPFDYEWSLTWRAL